MPRKKTFSPEAALDSLTELFLERGHEALTVQDIADAIGISRSTVYGTFGGKSKLFASMLERYGPARVPGLGELNDALSPRAALVRMFDPEIDAGAARCLVLDTIVRMPDSSPEVTELVKDAIEDLQECLVGAIERGRAVGEIAGSVDATGAAAALLSLYLGRYVLVRSGAAGKTVLAAVARQAQDLLPPPA